MECSSSEHLLYIDSNIDSNKRLVTLYLWEMGLQNGVENVTTPQVRVNAFGLKVTIGNILGQEN